MPVKRRKGCQLWPLLVVTLLLGSASQTWAVQWPWSRIAELPQQPHPAVVRVSVDESDGLSHGSGTLVDVRDRFGLVVTNWHVVRDAAGAIHITFPDGFRSAARVLRVDRDWDLAALLIWRPPVAPVPIAARAPQPGEPLTIAGYGSGNYRATTGRCTQYVAPSDHHPFEMVEISATARQGDSGGPIFNQDGELAGVLFGSGGGTTSGSYAGRVLQFLGTAWPPSDESDFPQSLATTTVDTASPETALQRLPQVTHSPQQPGQRPSVAPQLAPLPTPSQLAAAKSGTDRQTTAVGEFSAGTVANETLDSTETSTVRATPFTWQNIAGESIFEQGKTFLAIFGLFMLLAHSTRLLSPRIEAE